MTSLRTALQVAFATLCFATASQAQIFIVDAAGGPGSNFTDLPPAVAAVPDGATLRVRPGHYTPPLVTAKGLSIVGDDAATVILDTPTSVVPGASMTTATQTVLWKDLTLGMPTFSTLGPYYQVQDTSGPVVLDHVSFSTWYSGGSHAQQAPTLGLTRASNVLIYDSSFDAHISCFSGPLVSRFSSVDSNVMFAHTSLYGADCDQGFGQTPLRATRSRLLLYSSLVRGGNGHGFINTLFGPICFSGAGADAVQLTASTFICFDCAIAGGDGADGINYQSNTCFCPAYGGGIGISATNNSTVRLFAGSVKGGAAGQALPDCPAASPGQPFLFTSGSSLIQPPNAVPSFADLNGPSRRGTTISFLLQGFPLSPAILILAYNPALLPLDPISPGSLLQNSALVLGPLTIPVSGQLTIPFQIPATWPLGQTYYGQFATYQSGSNPYLWLTNVIPWNTVR